MPKHPPPRATLARNLKALMDLRKLSAPAVAELAKVDAKTINNMLHGRYDPRLDKVEQVASVFDLTAWEMITPGIADAMAHHGRIQQVIESYAMTDDAGRDSIAGVAEMAARPYRKKLP